MHGDSNFMSGFGFLNTAGLFGLITVVAFTVFLTFRERVRRERMHAVGVSPSTTSSIAVLLTLAAPLALCVALVRPYIGSTNIDLSIPGDDYMFVVDVSRSMLAKDVGPARIELSKRKLQDLIEAFNKDGTANRFGITLFAGDAYLFCPLTSDTTVVRQFIESISPTMVSSLGSNLYAGIRTALERFDASRSKSGRILLASDGEDDALQLEQVVRAISDAHIKVDVLGVGTIAGGPIPLQNGTFLRDGSRTTVITHLNEDSLMTIARAGGGIYVRATIGDSDILALTQSGRPEGTASGSSKRVIRTYGEFGSWFALIALLIMIALARDRTGRTILRSIAVMTCILPALTQAQQLTPSAIPSLASRTPVGGSRQAYEQYQARDYEQAAELFKQALTKDPSNRDLLQGYASALFKVGKIEEAEKIFDQLAGSARTGRDYFDNEFNKGNALLARKQFRQAIYAYTKALDVKPNDERALHNREVAKLLEEEEERRAKEATPTPSPTPTPVPSTAPSPEPSPKASPSPSPNPSGTNPPTPTPPSETPNGSPTPEGTQTPSSSPTPSTDGSPSPSHGSPKPNSTVEPSPSAQPSAGPSSAPAQTAAAPNQQSKERNAEDAESTPTPAHDEQTPTPQEDRLKEDLDAKDENYVNKHPAATPTSNSESKQDDRSLTEKEADAWLQSLPDSPLLIRKKFSSPHMGRQTW